MIVPDVGGGFGPKGGIYPEEILVAAASLRLGRPVKWVETRREDLMALGQDREQVHDVKIGFKRDGTNVALDGCFGRRRRVAAPGERITPNTVNHLPGPYRVPEYRNAGTRTVKPRRRTRRIARPAARAALVMARIWDIGARRYGPSPEVRAAISSARRRCLPPGTEIQGRVPTLRPGDFPAASRRVAMLERRGAPSPEDTQGAQARRASHATRKEQGSAVRGGPCASIRRQGVRFIGVTAQGRPGNALAQIAAAELGCVDTCRSCPAIPRSSIRLGRAAARRQRGPRGPAHAPRSGSGPHAWPRAAQCAPETSASRTAGARRGVAAARDARELARPRCDRSAPGVGDPGQRVHVLLSTRSRGPGMRPPGRVDGRRSRSGS